MKYLANERSARRAELLESSPTQFYTRNRSGQYELWPRRKTSASRYREIILVTGMLIMILIGSFTFIA